MRELEIVFTKPKDPSAKAVLTCVRTDGSRTWIKLPGAFPVHDMVHYAVETEMKVGQGFFGLIAQGWDIEDFGVPEKRAKMPFEALWVEHVVGIIWREYVTRDVSPYPEFCDAINATLEALREGIGRNAKRSGPRADYSDVNESEIGRQVSEEQRSRIMERTGETVAKWARTPPGEVLTLNFAID